MQNALTDACYSENKLLLGRMASNEQETERLRFDFAIAQKKITDLTDQLCSVEQARLLLQGELIAIKKEHALVGADRTTLASQLVQASDKLAATLAEVNCVMFWSVGCSKPFSCCFSVPTTSINLQRALRN